jgi:hypothetical protein
MARQRLAVGGVVLAVIAAFALALWDPLTRAEPRSLGSNLIDNRGGYATLGPGDEICQDAEGLPGDAREVVLEAGADRPPGGPLRLAYKRTAQSPPVVRARTRRAIQATGVAIATLPPHEELYPATLCVRNEGSRVVRVGSAPAGAAATPGALQVADIRFQSRISVRGAKFLPLDARMRVAYGGANGEQSALDMAGEVARRAGMWRGGLGGTATSWLALALAVVAGAGAVVLLLRRPGTRRAVVACAAIALANGVAWAYLTPPFQGPDELGHASYVQYVAETGQLPRAETFEPSAQLALAGDGVQFSIVQPTNWLAAREASFERRMADASPRGGPGAGYVSNNPPLYYWLMAAPYELGGDFYGRLMLMRFATAMLAALAAALTYLFVAELLPGRRVPATLAGIAVGLQPVFGFLGGLINPDMLLIAEGAALLWLGARAMRRGLTLRIAIAMGVVLAAALLTKPAGLGLVPGVLAILAVVVVRLVRLRRLRAVGAVLAVLITALVLYGGYREIEGPLLGREADPAAGFSNRTTASGRPVQFREGLSYAWQFFLPRLPFMSDHQAGSPWRDIYFQDFVGRFGWHEWSFSREVANAGLILALVVLVLALHALWRARAALRRRWLEAAAVLGALAALALVVAAAGYRYRLDTGQSFEQVRYLFPYLLPVYGAFVALAVVGARRWALPAASGLATIAALHNLAALLATLDRYYL